MYTVWTGKAVRSSVQPNVAEALWQGLRQVTVAARTVALTTGLSFAVLSLSVQGAGSLSGGPLQEITIDNHFSLDSNQLSSEPDRVEYLGEAISDHLWVVPTMASSPGQFGAYFKTRVIVTNPSNNAFQVGVSLFNASGKVKDSVLSLGPKQTLSWNDFLAEALEYTGAGAVVFDSWLGAATGPVGNRIILTAEVYSDSPNGRFKTVVNRGVLWRQFVPNSEPYNAGITVNSVERTNIGAFNPSTSPTQATAQVYSSTGGLVETIVIDLPAQAWGQRAVTQQVTNGFIKWNLTGPAYLYAVTVNNQSNDGTMLTAVQYNGDAALDQGELNVSEVAEGGRLQEISSFGDDEAVKVSLASGPDKHALSSVAQAYYTVPSMASAPGQFGAYFKTKVVITNDTNYAYPIYATLYNNNGLVKRVSIQMGAKKTVYWDDFLAQAMGYTGAGAVIFDSWYGPTGGSWNYIFLLTAEVYSESPGGKYKTVVSDGPEWVRQSKENIPYNIGINVNAQERTNIGVFNFRSSASLAVKAEVFDASGSLVETLQFSLGPRAWEQKPLTVPVTNGTVKWTLADAAYVYAVTVDNTSNDGTMMPAVDHH
jgi:hypothetical protein